MLNTEDDSMRKALLLILALMLTWAPAWGLSAEKRSALDELDMSRMVSGYVEVPGRGAVYYYAQNDPLWGGMAFRFPDQAYTPLFSGSGCVPSALANAFSNLAEDEVLARILDVSYQKKGYFLCSCSMTRKGCYENHNRFQVQEQADVKRFFSLLMGSYMAGNNPRGEFANGNFSMVWELARLLDLSCTQAKDDFGAAARAVSQGAMAIMLVGGQDCPFTKTGHALVLCGVGEEEYYFLDSFRREYYELDRFRSVRVIEPGLVAVPKDKLFRLGAYQIYILSRPEEMPL